MNQAYKQFGNSVVVPLIEAIGENIVDQLYRIKTNIHTYTYESVNKEVF